MQGYLIGRRDSQYHWKQWINTDFDSDFVCANNDKNFLKIAKHSWGKTPIPVNNIPQEKVKYNYSIEDKWKANCKLKNSYIGSVTNLAQIAVSQVSELKLNKDKYENAEDRIKKLEDIIIVLVVLSNVAIDNAKRVYDCDLGAYLRSCKKEDCWIRKDSKIVKPQFFKGVDKNPKSIFMNMACNIDMLKVEAYKDYNRKENLVNLLKKPVGKYNDKQEADILELLDKADKRIRKERLKISVLNDDDREDDSYKIINEIKDDLAGAIQKKKIKEVTYIDMVRKCFKDKRWTKYTALCLEALIKYRDKETGELMVEKCLK